MMRLLIQKIKNMPKIVKYGIVTNTLFGVTLRVSADGVQQNLENQSPIKSFEQYDLVRTKHIAGIGFILGPIVYVWYNYLDKILPGKTFKIISKKILLDQFIGGTAFTFIFIIGMCLMQGQTINDSLKEFIQKFPLIYMVDWLIWPPTMYLNFYFLPTQLRVIFVNIILFCWNVFLSYVKYKDFN